MANEIIEGLISSGKIVKGSFLLEMQKKYPYLYETARKLKKEITERTQEKYINGVHDIKSCDCIDCIDGRELSQFIWKG